MGRDALGARIQNAVAEARDGFSFVYLAYPIVTALMTGQDEGHATHILLQFYNDIPFTTFAKAVTGEPNITKIDAQATWFRGGR